MLAGVFVVADEGPQPNPLPQGEGARRERGPEGAGTDSVLAGGGGLDWGGFGSVSGWAGEFDRGTDGFCGNIFFCGLRLDDLLLWTGDRGIGGFNL